MRDKGLLTSSERAVERHIEAHDKNPALKIKPFHQMGQNKVMKDKTIDLTSEELNSKFVGKDLTRKDASARINKEIAKQKEREGMEVSSQNAPN